MNDSVPTWKNTSVHSIYSLESASTQQKLFYTFFKSEFIKGRYLDVKDNINYLCLLMYDFEDEFRKDNNYVKFSSHLEALVTNYPIMIDYKKDAFIYALFKFAYKYDWKNLPILEAFVSVLTEEMHESSIIVKPIDWVLGLLKCTPNDKDNIHKLNVVFVKLMRRLGFGIVPNSEIENRDFSYGEYCAIYKTEGQYNKLSNEWAYDLLLSFSRKDEYKFVEVFIRIAIKVILEDKINQHDYEYIDAFISKYTINEERKGIPKDAKSHLKAVARWRLSSKKPILDKATKRFIIERLSSQQREILSQSLLKIACYSGYISSKRIESLKNILPFMGINAESIHSQIHRLVTDNDGFAVIEKKLDSIEFTLNENSGSPQSTPRKNVIINPKKLQILEQQTKTAQELLSTIFTEEQPIPPKNITSGSTTSAWMEVFKVLLSKELWNRVELESICRERGLMPAAVLEQINDYVYEKVNDTIIDEDGDRIYVSLEYKEELI